MSLAQAYAIPKKKMEFMVQCSVAWGLPQTTAQHLAESIDNSTKDERARAEFQNLYNRIKRTAEDYCYQNQRAEKGREPRQIEVTSSWTPLKNKGLDIDIVDLWNRMGRG